MNTRETGRAVSGQVLLRLGPLDRVRLSVVMAEYLSTLSVVVDAIGGLRRGVPAPWRTQLQGSLTRREHEAFAPTGSQPSPGWIPDCLLPLPAAGDVALDETVEVLRSARAPDVGENLTVEFGSATPAPWRPALDNPGRWIESCGDALDDVAAQLQSLWQRARPLHDREVERAGVASMRGAVPVLLNSLNSKITYTDETLIFAHAVPGTYELGDRELVLAPVVTGDQMIATYFADPHRVWISYPLPGLGPLWSHAAIRPTPGDQLSSLIGSTAAMILRSLQRPAHMRDLVCATQRHPNVVTRECARLEAAGLIERHRAGRNIRITPTPLAQALLDLYS